MSFRPIELSVRPLARDIFALDIGGDLSAGAEPALFAAYAQAERAGARKLVLNFTQLHHIDTLGAGLLVTLVTRANDAGLQLSAAGLSAEHAAILSVTQLSEALPVYTTEADAAAALIGAGVSSSSPASLVGGARSPESSWAKPVSELKIEEIPDGALNLNLEGRRMAGPLQGFGQLWQKTFRLRLKGLRLKPAEVIQIWKENLPKFKPPDKKFFVPPEGMTPGELVFIHAWTPGGPVNTGVMVLYSGAESFTLMTVEGHPESGWVTFMAYEEGGETVAQIRLIARASDPLYELAFRLLGSRVQDDIWGYVLKSLATHLGVSGPLEVESHRTLLDPKVQWARAGNLRHNAQLLTTAYYASAPARWLAVQARRYAQAALWLSVYLLLTLAPLFVLFQEPRPAGREFWREFSVALGYAGLGMMALQFVLTARFQTLKAPYGSDLVYYFHRQISLVAFTLILAHPLILFIYQPETLGLLNVLDAPWRARFGVTALVCLILLIGLSLWRQQIKLDYTPWRLWHGVLATLAVTLAMGHVVLVGHYINTPWKQALWLGYAIFWIGLLAYVRVLKPLQLLRSPYTVTAVTPERGRAWTLELQPNGHAGLQFQPGQFAWITVRASPFALREHPFSFSSAADRSGRLAFTIKEFGNFTRGIKDVKPGETVYVDGPYGSFSMDHHPRARGFVFIAGGVGITPMISMLRTLAARGDRRPLLLIYGNKDWESVTFREELAALSGQLNLRVVHVLSDPPPAWTGERGYLTGELLRRHLPPHLKPDETEIFICGPQVMLDSVEVSLAQMGVPLGDFHSERFNLV